jgi:hypothetical protein
MAIKTFTSGSVLTASDTNTYLNNGGLVYITQGELTSSTAALIFNDVFSSTYDNYRIVIDRFRPTDANRALIMRYRVGGTDANANYTYSSTGLYQDGTTTNNSSGAALVTFADTGTFNSLNSVGLGSVTMDIIAPFKTERTFNTYQAVLYNAQYGNRNGFNTHTVETSFTGFSLFAFTGNTTNLRCKVYGYRQA